MLVTVVRGIAAIAGVVFLVCPLSTWTLVLAFCSSVVVFLICQIALGSFDETFTDDDTPTGYWPPKPVEWKDTSKNREDKNSIDH